jgi:SAM-dependent methyltransferase
MENEKDPHYYSHARVDLIRFIPPEIKKILEVGCGGGMTGKALRERGFVKIVGIEINEEVVRGFSTARENGKGGEDESFGKIHCSILCPTSPFYPESSIRKEWIAISGIYE